MYRYKVSRNLFIELQGGCFRQIRVVLVRRSVDLQPMASSMYNSNTLWAGNMDVTEFSIHVCTSFRPDARNFRGLNIIADSETVFVELAACFGIFLLSPM